MENGAKFYNRALASSYPEVQEVDPALAEKVRSLDPRIVIPIALADANDIRRALAIGEGKLEKLPAAVLGNAEDCVLARALSNGWSASVGTGGTDLKHRASGISFAQVKLAVETLAQLGFVGVNLNPERDLEGSPTSTYEINVLHTWAMYEFINWYDKGAFPELVLDEDQAGVRVTEEFQGKIEAGVPLRTIHDGHDNG